VNGDRSSVFPSDIFNRAGLNRQAIFNISDLPAEITAELAPGNDYRQLILLGHGGRLLWEQVKASGIASANPIDDFTVATINQCFARHLPTQAYRIVYPGEQPIGLQQLGKLAGWHQPSPFMVGIDAEWGSWYAYRAVVLAATNFPCSLPVTKDNPCASCREKTCVTHCPAGALEGARFSLEKCVAYRKQPQSACRCTCLARVSCPVGSQHKYSSEQLQHTYSISLKMIERYY